MDADSILTERSSTDCIIDNKVITIEPKLKKPNKPVILAKPKCKRVITTSKKWTFLTEDLDPTNQGALVKDMLTINQMLIDQSNQSKLVDFIQQQIKQKIYGYKSQDLLKSKYDESKFVDYTKILEMMVASDMKCYYCHKPYLVIYEYVREPRQWTVERIDNKFGHNKDNIEIACLDCNLHRRTMYHERYVFTKNLNIVKMDSEDG